MNCKASSHAFSLEIDRSTYQEVIVHGSKRGKKDKDTGEQIVYYQGITYLPNEWVNSSVVCVLLEERNGDDPTSLPPGTFTHHSGEKINHYGVIIQKTKTHSQKINGKEYQAAYVQVPQGWVDKKMGIYRLKD